MVSRSVPYFLRTPHTRESRARDRFANDGNTVNDVPIINGRIAYRNTFRQPGFLDWDARLLKQFRFGDRMRLDFSIEGFNLTSSSNKQFNGDGESPFGTPQATINPATGLAYTSSTALIPKSSPR